MLSILSDSDGLRPASELRELLGELKALVEDGKLKTVIDRVYPLEQTATAYRYIETGCKKGNVVLAIAPHPTV